MTWGLDGETMVDGANRPLNASVSRRLGERCSSVSGPGPGPDGLYSHEAFRFEHPLQGRWPLHFISELVKEEPN